VLTCGCEYVIIVGCQDIVIELEDKMDKKNIIEAGEYSGHIEHFENQRHGVYVFVVDAPGSVLDGKGVKMVLWGECDTK